MSFFSGSGGDPRTLRRPCAASGHSDNCVTSVAALVPRVDIAPASVISLIVAWHDARTLSLGPSDVKPLMIRPRVPVLV